MLQNSGVHNKRLLGIDLFRGIAAYGVVLIHGLGEIPRDGNALFLSHCFLAFCVPFFLAVSFYFSSNLLLLKGTKNYLINRLKKIIIPYFAWTVIYLLVRAIGWLIGHKEPFNKLMADPINIIFFGASGVQLYFLPMLFCGTLAAIPITKLFKITKIIQNKFLLYLCLLLSIYLGQLIATTGNDFVLGEGIAFKQMIDLASFSNLWLFQFMRLILVVLAWTIKCLPFIIFSLIINNVQSPASLDNYIDIGRPNILLKFLILIVIPLLIGIGFIYDLQLVRLLIPYISLLYAILISGLISQSKVISLISNKLGYFSFGIYLVHALITAGFMPVIVKLYPKIISFQLSSLMLIMSSAVIFLISLSVTYFISLNKTVARVLLAI